MKLIHGGGAEGFHVTEADELRLPECQPVKAGYGRAALLSWIRVVDAVVVEEIAGGKLTPPAVAVDSYGSFIIPNSLRKTRRGILIGSIVGDRNILQQIEGWCGPRALKNYCARKYAVRSGAASLVVRLTRCNRITKLRPASPCC